MKQSAVASLLLLVLLLSLILVLSSFNSAGAASGGVYIQADGTVQGTNDIQRNGDLYTFVGNFSGPLYVQKDNVVIDGGGYALTGANGRGIVLAQRDGVTLKNTEVMLDGGYSIDVESAADCALIGNTLVGTPETIPGLTPSPLAGPIAINFLHSQNITVKDNTITNFYIGISLEWSNGHTITGNTLDNGIIGIELWNTTGCVFRDNRLSNCSLSIPNYPSYQYNNDLDSSNTLDDKPIIYLVNAKDQTTPTNAAYIILVNCRNIIVQNSSPEGIMLVSTTNSKVSDILMTARGNGITLLGSSNINIVDNILRNQAIGIEIQDSSNNLISDNEISNSTSRGLNLDDASNNVISRNIITNNSYGITASSDSFSNDNIVSSNNFTGNSFTISPHGRMRIQNNVFEGNEFGIMFSSSSGSTITENTFANNINAVYFNSASGNTFYLNNFLKNSRQVADAGLNSSTQTTGAGFNSGTLQLVEANTSGVNFIPPPPPSTNRWDNGSLGNYWIDYKGSDHNGDGIGDTPYYLYENNQDNYPLMNPVSVSGPTTIPSSSQTPAGQSPENTKQKTANQELPIVYIVIAIIAVAVTIAAWTYLFSKRKSANTGNQLMVGFVAALATKQFGSR